MEMRKDIDEHGNRVFEKHTKMSPEHEKKPLADPLADKSTASIKYFKELADFKKEMRERRTDVGGKRKSRRRSRRHSRRSKRTHKKTRRYIRR